MPLGQSDSQGYVWEFEITQPWHCRVCDSTFTGGDMIHIPIMCQEQRDECPGGPEMGRRTVRVRVIEVVD
jgi:hypothetical protein